MATSLDGCMGGSYLLSYQELEEKDFEVPHAASKLTAATINFAQS